MTAATCIQPVHACRRHGTNHGSAEPRWPAAVSKDTVLGVVGTCDGELQDLRTAVTVLQAVEDTLDNGVGNLVLLSVWTGADPGGRGTWRAPPPARPVPGSAPGAGPTDHSAAASGVGGLDVVDTDASVRHDRENVSRKKAQGWLWIPPPGAAPPRGTHKLDNWTTFVLRSCSFENDSGAR